MNSFETLNLSQPILQALTGKGYTKPTAIQEQAIPVILNGNDIFGSADTGTGKTAAFALPLLHLMSQTPSNQKHRDVRTLVLAPTRELVMQIGDNFRAYGKHLDLRLALIYGGVSQHSQTNLLRKGVDIIIATPGRLLDLIGQGYIKLNKINYLVFDEADRMLEMGFLPSIKSIVSYVPTTRQTLFFSATVPNEIKKLAATLLHNPVNIEVKATNATKVNVKQSLFFIDKSYKKNLLLDLIASQEISQAIVFTRTKHTADRLARALHGEGISAEAIHGDKSQGKRQKTLADFKNKKISFLVATDLASRGIDVKELPYVINFDLPQEVETYTHRIGRTARAGSHGVALSFCSPEEKLYLRSIQRVFGPKITIEQHAFLSMAPQQIVESDERHSQPTEKRFKPAGSGFAKRGHGQQRNHFRKRSQQRENGAFKHSKKPNNGEQQGN